MLEGYLRNIQNAHALRSLLKAPVMPAENLAIAGDDEMSSVPLLIFRDQHLPIPGPVREDLLTMPFEKAVPKGSGVTLSMEDFPTDDFNLGAEYDFIV